MSNYDARAVSNEFVKLAADDDNSLTPMQALKLVYIAHGYSLGYRSTPLIKNRIEAWRYGPVIPDLYQSIKHFRSSPVEEVMLSDGCEISDDDKDFLKAVYGAYGKFNGIKLSEMTHRDGTPWDQVYQPLIFGKRISNDLIEDHYKKLLDAAQE